MLHASTAPVSAALRATLVAALSLAACDAPPVEAPTIELPSLSVTAWSPDVVLPGSTLRLQGAGFLPPETATTVARLDGTVGGSKVVWEGPAAVAGPTELLVTVDDALLSRIPADGPPLVGTLRITRTLLTDGSGSWFEVPVTIHAKVNLRPVVKGLAPAVLFPGDAVTVDGADFLLPGEGTSAVVFTGTVATDNPPATRTLTEVFIPGTTTTRTMLRFTLTPDLFGIRPGRIQGSLRVVNVASSGDAMGSEVLAGIDRPLERPYLDAVTPTTVSRGQILRFDGRGFLPTDAAYEATTLLLVEGTFRTKAGKKVTFSGLDSLSLFPDRVTANTSMDYVLRVNMNLNGELQGLGLTAGTLEGTVSPWILTGSESVLGKGIPIAVTVLPQRQIVWLKYLPGFSASLEHFGLRAVERRIKDRILAVCDRDYVGVNIAFREDKPTDFAEYGVVEVGGADPNSADLFGLDNTEGKDVGNLRFNDVIGGLNAETETQGYYGYGGIFMESFLGLSPTLGHGSLPIRDPRFDDLFGAFIPELGGEPVQPSEVQGGPREVLVAEAVRVLGNLVGNTITHEVGHSLGLAAIDGEFHNVGDNPGWIMDAGAFRPFAERAEIDGQGPGIFAPFDRAYLESVLPQE
ncbi:MAG: hypothetical protein AMXMBFR64_35570 [Myxococcales bacterium]